MEDDPDIVDLMIDYLYRLDYDDHSDGDSGNEPNERLIVNSLVYAIADKCDIRSLKELAKTKTATLLDMEWNDDSFPTVLESVWTTTPQSDRGLRDLFIPVLCTHRNELVKKEHYILVLRANADLAVDIVQALCSGTESFTYFGNTRVAVNYLR